MDTHRDIDAPNKIFDMFRLQERAKDMRSRGESQITGGKPGEDSLRDWTHGGITCRQMPDDEQGILRISIGGGIPGQDVNYCVFRGDQDACRALLRKALNAMGG